MSKADCFAVKGNIIYSETIEKLSWVSGGYLVCENGKVMGVYERLPKEYAEINVTDYGDRLIIPGLTDLHTHAPQYSFRGLSMDLELIDWLGENTFPEEAKFYDTEYAKRAYTIFANDLKRSVTYHEKVNSFEPCTGACNDGNDHWSIECGPCGFARSGGIDNRHRYRE